MTPSKRHALLVLAALVLVILLVVSLRVTFIRPHQVPLPVSGNAKLRLSSDGQSLLYWEAGEMAVRVRNLTTGVEHRFPTTDWASYCFAPDGGTFALLYRNKQHMSSMAQVEWRDTASGKLLRSFGRFYFPGNALVRRDRVRFAPNGKSLRVITEEGQRILPLDGAQQKLMPWPKREPEIVAWCDKYWLREAEVTSKRDVVELYDANTGRLLRTMPMQRKSPLGTQLSPDSSLVALRDIHGVMGMSEANYCIDLATGQRLKPFNGRDFVFTPDSRHLVVQRGMEGDENELFLCDARTGQTLRQLYAPASQLNLASGTFTPDGKYFYVVDASRGAATVWKIRVQ